MSNVKYEHVMQLCCLSFPIAGPPTPNLPEQGSGRNEDDSDTQTSIFFFYIYI